MSKTVYVPVAVTVDDEGTATFGTIDYEGAPWMYCGREDVFDEEEGEWQSSSIESDNADIVNEAESFVAARLSKED